MASEDNPSERCSWCGIRVEAGDGYRAVEHPGDRAAAFCRLEHIVPWVLQGAHWQAGGTGDGGRGTGDCAHCGTSLQDVYVLLTRHRGDHRIADAFCSADHLAEWAKSGGRWR